MTPFPAFVEFQTLSHCNARCRVCPMEWTADALPQGRMSDALLSRLLSELEENKAEIRSIEPYLNNEPLLDKRFLSTLRSIRRWFPGNIEVSTNASLLTPQLSQLILEERLISDFRFSVFGASREVHEAVMGRMRWDTVRANIEAFVGEWHRLASPISAKIVFVHNPRLQPEDEPARVRELWKNTGLDVIVWEQLDRIGNVPVPVRHLLPARPAARARGCKMGYMKDRVAILYDGRIALCCQDWSRSHIIGNIDGSSLQAVWAGSARSAFYDVIYGSQPKCAAPCNKCELYGSISPAYQPHLN